MLIPRFTLRRMLLIVTVSGVFFLVVSLALQGQRWAIGISLAIGSVLLSMLIQACFFLAAWLLVKLWGGRHGKLTGSPFALAQPPPQWIQPVEPE